MHPDGSWGGGRKTGLVRGDLLETEGWCGLQTYSPRGGGFVLERSPAKQGKGLCVTSGHRSRRLELAGGQRWGDRGEELRNKGICPLGSQIMGSFQATAAYTSFTGLRDL